MKQGAATRIGGVVLATVTLLGMPAVPAAAQTVPSGTSPGFDGDANTTERLAEGHPTYAAVDISRLRFADVGAAGRHAAHVVLSRDGTFADSVAGSALSDDGPLLLTATDQLPPVTATEISRVLPAGGRVFLLGGPAAISGAVEQQLRDRGYPPQRLAGATRIETAVAVADAVRARHPGDDVLLARAAGPSGNDTAAWADSIAGGAIGAFRHIPILITQTAGLDGPVAAWLARDAPAATILLGGEAALSPAVAAKVPNPRRVSGAERTATAAAIATELWGASSTGPRKFLVTNGAAELGWSFGFAAAGLAADARAPVLLVTSEVTGATVGLTRTCGPPQVDLLIVGDGTVVPAPMREQLDAADRYACGPQGALVYPSNLESFPQCAAVLDYFRRSALEHVGPYGLGGYGDYAVGGGALPPSQTRAETAPTQEAAQPGAPADSTTSGTSSTNVQEEGVDEPDVVKTDGRFLYSVSGAELRIVAIGDGTPRLAAKLNLGTAGSHELLLSGTRLLVVTGGFSFGFGGGGVDGGPAPAGATMAPVQGRAKTILTSIDVTDPTRPAVGDALEIEGDYRSARMIGSVARVVIQSDPDAMPFVYPSSPDREAERAAAEQNRTVVESSSLDTWLPGYLVRRADGAVGEEGPVLDCAAVRSPPIFAGLGTLSVVTVDLTGAVKPTSSAGVIAAGQTVYASLSRLFISTGRWGWEADALDQGPSTEVHGFNISEPTATTYVGSGVVPGYILNQFALSEHQGNLRVATTTQAPWRDPGVPVPSDNGVHVLAEQGVTLVEIGRVTGLGRGERIFGVRFFGDIGAVVTFRQIDPLFLLDLSQPTAPRVTGELKIPGYSAYLHRVAPDRLLGVGRAATTTGTITGAQVSLFDIADKTAPRLVQSVQYPNGNSLVEFDHHAFLYWPTTSLAVVPLSEFTSSGPGFDGAVGLNVSATGLSEAGRASHADEPGTDAGTQITRSVVAANTLFTVSDAGVEAGDLATLQRRSFLVL